ncbi:riboflavin synthase [Corynebacterium uropygiale]|uniref:Riboflavin synthase n=1 Tax=Corynebacterium uropygiale TaxID=1775911 RepID=A0A9X1QNV4_9CORY|nr:riboflavin synthase [Corynebacterium uropygiale]MCF4006579.1 riboflavin synthase [Corynebacterium uropygiale]
MFTGIVTAIGSIEEIISGEESIQLRIKAPGVLDDAHLGDSLAVNGVCLTVTSTEGDTFTADCMKQTLDLTTLGSLQPGDRVNIEPALAVGGRLGGHIVQGHVDTTAELISRQHTEQWDVLRFALPAAYRRYVVPQGSIALNGTSLTVSAVGEDWCEVSLIPTTLAETTHGELQVGDRVNVEVDVLGKYVERLLSAESYPRPFAEGTTD